MTPNNHPREQTGLLLTCLFLWELSIAVMAVAISMNGDRSWALFITSQAGWVFLLALGIGGLTTAAIIRQYVTSRRVGSSHFRLTVTMNLIMVLVVLLTGEVTVRLGTTIVRDGEEWRWRVLLPRNWEQVAAFYRQLLTSGGGRRLSYLTYDDVMGWTLGPNRKSANGLYYSSAEGIRASREGVSFAKASAKTRIALVGDSFTFGDNVPYEESWGYLLEKALGPEFEVLNFGVSGYAVDQAYLRYEKDVRPWHPKLVIFGFISDDVERSMRLYHSAMTSREGWSEFPFAKPRFILREGTLTRLNVPPLTPEALYSKKSIDELPALQYDRGYRPGDWQVSWMHRSYLARVLLTLLPHWETVSLDISDEALLSVNAAILQAFIKSAQSEGSIPLVVYFPENNAELEGPLSPLPMGRQVLQKAGTSYADPTSCVQSVPPAERFIQGGWHYSPQSNAQVARCLRNAVREALALSPH
ncbi:MAG: SGNH/GDSL hydrolase family protein [Nitrospira sp.]|nr:SGNH/GDSL hydrolase family protein [Nitrospira sp.]